MELKAVVSPDDWKKPVNEGHEVFRLGESFIVEIKRQNHWVDYAV